MSKSVEKNYFLGDQMKIINNFTNYNGLFKSLILILSKDLLVFGLKNNIRIVHNDLKGISSNTLFEVRQNIMLN